jgi:pyruvate/2-oxoglutarate dehydrogenase complex dihydrolipoamide dehydrogenase (E3) component/uncharacterized membrane protein YdjX (TVP38/TMEM64 family)
MNNKIAKPLLLIAIVVLVASFFIFDIARFASLSALQAESLYLQSWVKQNFWGAWLVFVAAYVLIAALSLPGAGIMTLAAGAMFGLKAGLAAASLASTLGATLAFLSARFLLRESITKKFGARLQAINDGVKSEGGFYLLALRLVPAVPFFIVNLLMGLTPIRTLTYVLVSWIGMLPGTLAYIYAGTQLANLTSLKDVISPGMLLAFTALGLLPILMKRLTDFLKARRVYRGHLRPAKFDYNLIVIGAGAGGLVSSYIAAAVKAKVLLIEKHKMGGDCLNTGCVPSKALIRTAKLLQEAKHSQHFGIKSMTAEFDFQEVMQRVHRVIKDIEPHDSVERYTSLGVTCLQGSARLVSPWEVEVNGKRISARSIILASGARPLVPNLPGLESVDYVTSDTLWNLTELPKRLVVLGGGPIGCELAQAFRRFGAEVSVIEMSDRILSREDPDVSAMLLARFDEEGIRCALGHKAIRFEHNASGPCLVTEQGGQEHQHGFDKIIVALGRKANVEGFGLEELGVTLTPRGTIAADALMRTNFPNISVCGDATGPYQFTHVAAHQAWYAAVNQLLQPFWTFKVDYRVIPWATFTDPQVARVGVNETEAKAAGLDYEVTTYGIDDLDRAIADGAAHGVVKVITPRGKDQILGATIVGAEAGELIAEFVLAMKHGLGLNKILGTIHAYPTLMEANKYVAGNWKRAHAPTAALKWAARFFAWRRG